MKAIVNTAPNRLEVLEYPTPEPANGWVRIQTRCVGICSTDLKMVAGWSRTGFPAIPGHEWCGRVDAVGEQVDSSILHRLCVANNILPDGSEVGFEQPGGYAEYFLTRAENLHFLPDHFPPQHAALIEPIAVCLHALAKIQLVSTQPMLIFGDGPIGLLFLAIARSLGVQDICLVGGCENRLSAARRLGASQVIDYHYPGAFFQPPHRGEGYPLIIEASGSAAALEKALDLAAHNGQILVLGDYDDARASFRWNDLLHHEIHLIGSNASAGAWTSAVELATLGDFPFEAILSHQFPSSEFLQAVNLARDHKDECIKVILEWSH
jgi:2-desacetyl-2-hydroxyethyl bacteriochlorophyllide A dehydrogenase